jgi:hypothetical protein
MMDVGALPANVRFAAFLDYSRLMPRVDVFVTNGYGSLHAALAHGVPIVVAGDTEDKAENAARVPWSGAGINLRTGTRPLHRALGGVASAQRAELPRAGAADRHRHRRRPLRRRHSAHHRAAHNCRAFHQGIRNRSGIPRPPSYREQDQRRWCEVVPGGALAAVVS